ncbi:MAG TPA: hypothetical protein VJ251_20790, partial [Stellaceae bacterium]|nr:hypothetical protein [Stellaceae bacterium]
PPGGPGLLHGIGWTPDQTEVWQNGSWNDPHVYIWDMRNPMAPVLKERLTLRSGRGSHRLTLDIKAITVMSHPTKTARMGLKSSMPAHIPLSAAWGRRKTCLRSISPTGKSPKSVISMGLEGGSSSAQR